LIGQGGTDAASNLTRRVTMPSLLTRAEFALAVLAVATTGADAALAGRVRRLASANQQPHD
jgi:hypothetical protein